MKVRIIGKWLVDLRNMTCLNIENQILIVFEKRGAALEGKIKDIPDELLEKWTLDPHGKNQIRKTFIEADEIFFKEYFNKEIENKLAGM